MNENIKMLGELSKIMFTDYPDLVDVEQMQKMLSINRHTAYDIIERGELKAAKVGRKYRIPKLEIIRYLYNDSVSAMRKAGEAGA